MGGVDTAWLVTSIETLKISFGLKGNAKAEQVFEATYLPSKGERMSFLMGTEWPKP